MESYESDEILTVHCSLSVDIQYSNFLFKYECMYIWFPYL